MADVMRQNVFDHPNANANDWFDSPRAILEGPPLVLRSSNGHSASSGLQHAATMPEPLQSSSLHKGLFPSSPTQQNWQWHHLPPAVSSADQIASIPSSASLAAAASTMATHAPAEPSGTHDNPIPSSVISRPLIADYIPAQHQLARGHQDGSASQPLESVSISAGRRSSDPTSLHTDQHACSSPKHLAASMPMGFVPTAQAPSPPRRSPEPMPAAAPDATEALKSLARAHSTPHSRHSVAPAVQYQPMKRSRTTCATHTRAASTAKPRSSQFRGVTKHRRSGRWEAHIWVKELGRQVYLGGYEHQEHAAEAYDVAALKCKGFRVKTNFDAARYSDLTECMDSISLEELIMAVRRQSQGFSRGTSTYRGVTHHPSGRWEARIGIPGSKHIYLGLFNAEKEAAQAYDKALVRLRGTAAATNFALSDYRNDLAEYHKMQQTVLQSNKNMEDLLGSGQNFERWIKNGSVTRGNAAEEEDPPVALAAAVALNAELRAVTRWRSRLAAEEEAEDELTAADPDLDTADDE